MTIKLVDEKAYDIRYTSLQDEPYLKGFLLDSSVGKWFPTNSLQDVEAFAKNWVGFSRYQCSLTATYEGNPIGIATIFLMPYLKVAHLCMLFICVDPKFQNKGVGSSLLRNIQHLAKTKFPRIESMHLEVFENCPITALLEKEGFYKVFEQPKFVKLDGELKSRIVYEKQLR
jgi:ribosomal protein S18 acetylase RimI-like enzyme